MIIKQRINNLNEEIIPLISIVIPVYNVEKYIEKCLNSVINQSYKNLEIILVNDGSLDRSGDICDLYKEKDKRISVVHQDNKGLSMARNIGLEKATGLYIVFIDSDDWIEFEFIERLYASIKSNNAQIAVPNLSLVYDEDRIIRESRIEGESIYSNVEALKVFLFNGYITPCVASKMWETSLWKNIRCPAGRLFEDQFTTYQLIDLANKVVYNPDVNYYYLKREGSIGHSSFTRKTYDLLEGIEEEYLYIVHKYPKLKNTLNVARAVWELVFVNMMIMSEKYDYASIRKIQKRTRKNMKDIILCDYISYTRKAQVILFSFNFLIYRLFYKIHKRKNKIG